MTELTVNEFIIFYRTENEQIYDIEVHDTIMLESIKTYCDSEEFIRIVNNPRIAFYI
jgi:hypothetical protein